jgi:WD40 repeat protein
MNLLARVGEGTFGDHLAVSPDGGRLAVATTGGVLLADAASGTRSNFYPAPGGVDSLAFSPDGGRLAIAYRVPGPDLIATGDMAGLLIFHPVLAVVDLASGGTLFSLGLAGRGCGDYAAWDLAYAPDGRTLVFRDHYSLSGQGRAGNLCLLSAQDGSLRRAITIEPPWQTASPTQFSPDGRSLFVGVAGQGSVAGTAPNTRVRVYDAAEGSLVREFDGLGSIHDLALSPNGKWLALADDQGARLLSAQDGGLQVNFGQHSREVESLVFSPDGATLALGSLDGTASLWSAPDGRLLWQSEPWKPGSAIYRESPEAEIWDLAFSPDGQNLFALTPTHVIGTAGRVAAFRAADGHELYSLYGYNEISRPGISPDEKRIVFGGTNDGLGQVWSVTNNQPLFELKGNTGLILASVFSPDGRQIATAGMDGPVRLWQAADGSPLATLSGHSGPVRAVQYSPDGARLASVGDDGTLRLWAPGDGRLSKSIETHSGDELANSITFSLDGKSVILAYGCMYTEICPASEAGDLRRVDLESGQITTLLPQGVYGITFSGDQSSFGMESEQGHQSGRVEAGQYQARVPYSSPLGNGGLSGAAITPDGRLFFSGNAFGLHVWDVASGKMLALLKGSTQTYGDMFVMPDQCTLVIAQVDGLVSLWGVTAGK